jgi:hypothetical protein
MSSRNRNFAGRHSMTNPDWYTQEEVVEAARRTLGRIDCDPATDAIANRRIKARRIYTARMSGLAPTARWRGRVFLNPPGGQVKDFWDRMIAEREAGRMTAGIWVGYSLEQLQSLQTGEDALMRALPQQFPICYPRRRLAFEENKAKRAERLAKIDRENRVRRRAGLPLKKRKDTADSPSHANYIVYMGPDVDRFMTEFSALGVVVEPKAGRR